MLNADVRAVIKQLTSDLPDFYQASPCLQLAVAHWILEDRLPKNRKKRAAKNKTEKKT